MPAASVRRPGRASGLGSSPLVPPVASPCRSAALFQVALARPLRSAARLAVAGVAAHHWAPSARLPPVAPWAATPSTASLPGLGGNSATFHFLLFASLAGAVGVASKLAGAYHARAWKPHGVAATASLATVAWAVTALAFGLACKEMRVGGERGWRLRALTLAFTQLLSVLLLHGAVAGDRCGPGSPVDDQPTGTCNVR